MHLKIILNEPYPEGMAATNRIHYYAKGWKAAGHSVEILIPKPRNKGTRNKGIAVTGNFEGVPYAYTSGKTHKSGNKVVRLLTEYRGNLNAAKHILFSTEKTTAILLVSNELFHILFFKLIAFFAHAKYIQEKSEFPFFNRPKTLYRRLFVRYAFKCFDGMIVISEALQDYISKKLKQNSKTLLVPVLVNVSEFQEIALKTETKEFYLAYAGNLDERKDGILQLLEAFARVKDEFPTLRFKIAGDTSNKVHKQQVKALIAQLDLTHRVDLLGYISRTELVSTLCGASILLLAKPQTEQADFNFPSKVAEYLATGKPVLITDIGAIKKYLVDGVNAYLVESGNPELYANKITYILQNKEQAALVGQTGFDTAKNNFDYPTQVKRIVTFVQELTQHEQPT